MRLNGSLPKCIRCDTKCVSTVLNIIVHISHICIHLIWLFVCIVCEWFVMDFYGCKHLYHKHNEQVSFRLFSKAYLNSICPNWMYFRKYICIHFISNALHVKFDFERVSFKNKNKKPKTKIKLKQKVFVELSVLILQFA